MLLVLGVHLFELEGFSGGDRCLVLRGLDRGIQDLSSFTQVSLDFSARRVGRPSDLCLRVIGVVSLRVLGMDGVISEVSAETVEVILVVVQVCERRQTDSASHRLFRIIGFVCAESICAIVVSV